MTIMLNIRINNVCVWAKGRIFSAERGSIYTKYCLYRENRMDPIYDESD